MRVCNDGDFTCRPLVPARKAWETGFISESGKVSNSLTGNTVTGNTFFVSYPAQYVPLHTFTQRWEEIKFPALCVASIRIEPNKTKNEE